ncbi:MAG: pirin family protein [Rhodospirillales bacterium]
MSWQRVEEPDCPNRSDRDAVEVLVVPRAHDLGGLPVRRSLPSPRRRMVGPFVFFDQMGPTVFSPGQALDVRPHPHIGLATVTWLVEGEIVHRDSLGVVQPIRPGEVNWMTAGRGIVHSERSPDTARSGGARLCGIQTWIALPKRDEETAPAFTHYAAERIPVVEGDGVRAALIAGAAWGRRSPVEVFSETLYADVRITAGRSLDLPTDVEERGVYVLSGEIAIGAASFAAGSLLILKTGWEIVVHAVAASHVFVIGGAAMDGPRHVWWNFVSSSRERIEQAKRDWTEGRFARVPGEEEFIPLPE